MAKNRLNWGLLRNYIKDARLLREPRKFFQFIGVSLVTCRGYGIECNYTKKDKDKQMQEYKVLTVSGDVVGEFSLLEDAQDYCVEVHADSIEFYVDGQRDFDAEEDYYFGTE
jgi:hypothetical protein